MNENNMLKVGVVGCGAIGSEICRALIQDLEAARLVAANDLDDARLNSLIEDLGVGPVGMGLGDLIKAADLVVEATWRQAAPQIIRRTLQAGKDILVMSVGALLDHYDEFFGLAKEKECRIHVPSGALAGLDMVKAAALKGLDRVTITTCKPPRGLMGAPYIEENGIDLETVKEKTLVFSGNALQAVPAFPANVNVAAALSLAGLGPERTEVKIYADPNTKLNSHTVEAEGDFGRLKTECELVPSSSNPKTSLMASLSVISLLSRMTSHVVIGT